MDTKTIERRIVTAIPGARVKVADRRGTGDHFEVSVVADRFKGRSRVDCHRMVYDALAEMMRHEVHALTVRTAAPPEQKDVAD